MVEATDPKRFRRVQQRIATLCYEQAIRSACEEALELCRAALDHFPGHSASLELLEELSEAAHADELCTRYLAFLEHVPFGPLSPRVRVRIVDRLVELGRYEEALQHVSTLPPERYVAPATDDIDHACRIEMSVVRAAKPSGYVDDSLTRTQALDLSDVDFIDDPISAAFAIAFQTAQRA